MENNWGPFNVPKPVECPRCGNPARTVQEQVDTCPYCEERRRCFLMNCRAPESPTAEFPTWHPTPKSA